MGENGRIRIAAPSGIGDYSWLWSKLYTVRDLIEEIQIADGWPYRTVDYVRLCGVPSSYGRFTYDTILLSEKVSGFGEHDRFTWNDLYRAGLERNLTLIEPNRHLELGRRLEDWLPDLRTEFHYPLQTTAEDCERAKLLVDHHVATRHPMKSGPWLGVSCASYRGAEAWRTWGRPEWIDFLRRAMAEGWRPVLLGGSWDDLTFTVGCELELPDLVGKTSIAECVEVLRILDGYVGFSSGLNVIRTVLGKPAMALWPDHQAELSTSWAPPEMLEAHTYVASLYRPVEDVWPVARRFLKDCESFSSLPRPEASVSPPPSGEGAEEKAQGGT